ncbi:MAG: PEP-CTERM sorting domain-containing protein [Alphaproteobacteria bacterium]|nr:PEP-CTERM sorting domain-containing protein [Alphaproteobacteria bacterium]
MTKLAWSLLIVSHKKRGNLYEIFHSGIALRGRPVFRPCCCAGQRRWVFGTYGSTTVNGGNFDIVSNPTTMPYGGLYYHADPGSLTVGGLTTLSATYDMTTGSFGAGSPRFTLFDAAETGSAYLYFGTPLGGGSFTNPSPNNVFSSTGNYADLASLDLRVESNGFNGYNNQNHYVTFADFLASVGRASGISYVFLDLDGGYATTQELLIASFRVNAEKFTAAPAAVPEPMTLTLFGAGLAGAAALRRRKKMQKA